LPVFEKEKGIANAKQQKAGKQNLWNFGVYLKYPGKDKRNGYQATNKVEPFGQKKIEIPDVPALLQVQSYFSPAM
jgi:hypothetical protein